MIDVHSNASEVLLMLDAVVGAVIMVVATTSLLYSIELAERAFDQAGRYPLNVPMKRRCCAKLVLVDDARQICFGETTSKRHLARWG